MARNKFDVDEKLESPFQWSHLKMAGKYVGRHKYKMLLALVLSGVASVAALYIPKITQWVLDEAVPNGDTAMIGRLALTFVGIIALGIALNTIRSRMMVHVSQQIIHDIRSDLFAHLQKLPFTYYDSRPAGKILVRVINYVNSVSDILSNGIINMILEIINLVFIVVFMFSTNVTLSTVIIAGLPFFIAVILIIKPRQRKAWQNQSNKNSNYNAYLAESIDGVRVSQLFDRQEVNIGIMKKLATACRQAWMRAVRISNTVWLTSETMTQIVLTFLYIAGVYWMGGGEMVSFGVILAMGQYVSRFWQPITNLANIYNSFVNNIAYLERIFETMNEPVTVDDAEGAEELPDLTGEADFEDVTFAYEEGTNVLEHMNLHVKAGESIALVGPTGAGRANHPAREGRQRAGYQPGYAALPAQPARDHDARQLYLQRHGDGQHPLRPAGRHGRRSEGSGGAGARGRADPPDAGGIQNRSEGAREQPEPGREAADCLRPDAAERPGHPDPGRSDLLHRHADGEAAAGGHQRDAEGPDQHHRGPPAEHDQELRPDPLHQQQGHRRGGQPRRADGEEGTVLPAVHRSGCMTMEPAIEKR